VVTRRERQVTGVSSGDQRLGRQWSSRLCPVSHGV